MFAANIDIIKNKISGNRNLEFAAIAAIGLLTLINTLMIFDSYGVFESEINYEDVMPQGEPEVYGTTLDISYQDVSETDRATTEETIEILGEKDRNIELEEMSEEQLRRYISITTEISCEYCCDVPAITRPDGEKACVCEHSYAMRGLAKYLITEHSNEFSDEEVLEELSKWKIRFFPDQHMQKTETLQEEGYEVNPINLASNEYRGIQNQQGNQGEMVGSC